MLSIGEVGQRFEPGHGRRALALLQVGLYGLEASLGRAKLSAVQLQRAEIRLRPEPKHRVALRKRDRLRIRGLCGVVVPRELMNVAQRDLDRGFGNARAKDRRADGRCESHHARGITVEGVRL